MGESWCPATDFVALLAAALAVYWPALAGGELWDDAAHVTRPALRSVMGLWRIWTVPGATQQYYPVLHSAFWLEWRLWGSATVGYHLANVALHAGAACLVIGVLARLGVFGARFAGLLFLLHPVGVESVAWISEQKNTLSAVFYLAGALAYLRYRSRPTNGNYAMATALFVLAVLSKSVTATLPAALLLAIWWREGRLGWRDLRPLLPWSGFGMVAGLSTAWIERSLVGARGPDFALSFAQRCLLASRAIWFYFGKLCRPYPLIFIYPRWTLDVHSTGAWLGLGGLAILAIVTWRIRRRSRSLLAGTLFFAGTLFPALGFFNVYPFRFSYVADHFQYLASLGPITVFAAWMAGTLETGEAWAHAALVTAGALIVVLLGEATWRQAALYRDARTLYRATIERNPGCWLAYTNLGVLCSAHGELTAAVADFRRSIELKPDYADTHLDLGNAWMRLGRLDRAEAEFRWAARLKPDDAAIGVNLGATLAAEGRLNEAAAAYRRALALKPDEADAHFDLANVLLQLGRPGEAIGQYREAVRLRPTDVRIRNNLGIALANSGDISEAIAVFQKAARLDRRSGQAAFNLGLALTSLHRWSDAAGWYRQALAVNPENPMAYYRLAEVEAALGHYGQSKKLYATAARLTEARKGR